MKNLISACIIVKNEEKWIEKCIRSLLPVANEIIILDTGSTDNTKNICRGMGAYHDRTIQLFETKWENDFAKARNKCISYATGDWILVLDADENLTEEAQKQLPLIVNYPDFEENKPFVVSLKTELTFLLFNDERPVYFYRNVLFKNKTGIHYEGIVHEDLACEKDLIKFAPLFVSIINNRTISKKEIIDPKTEKYIDLLNKTINDNPDGNNDYMSYYHLGNAYKTIEKHNEALTAYTKAFSIFEKTKPELFSNNLNFYGAMLVMIINELLFDQKDYHQGLEYCNKLKNFFPEFSDAYFFTAYASQNLGKYNNAIDNYKLSVSLINKTPHILFSYGEGIKELCFLGIGRCCIVAGKKSEGIEYLIKGYNESSKSSILLHIIKFYLLEEDFKNLIPYYFKYKTNLSFHQKENIRNVFEKHQKPEYFKIIIDMLDELLKQEWNEDEKIETENKLCEIKRQHEEYFDYLITRNEKLKNLHKITACIITNNSEKSIEKCIKSLLTVASEIIVIDTGSTDKTKNICRGVLHTPINQTLTTIKIYETDEKNENLKNLFFSYATGKWIICIEPDEELDGYTQNELLTFLQEFEYDEAPDVFYFKSLEMDSIFIDSHETFKRCLFKNQPQNIESNFNVKPEFIIYHNNKYYSSEEQKTLINQKIEFLIKQTFIHPKNFNNYFYTGNEYLKKSEYKKAFEFFLKSYDVFIQNYDKKPTFVIISEYFCILINLIKNYSFNQNSPQEAAGFINEILNMSPDFPDALFFLAYLKQKQNNLRDAINIYIYLINLIDKKEDFNPFGIPSLGNALILMSLYEISRCYWVLGDNLISLNYLYQCYKVEPESSLVKNSLVKYHIFENNLSEAIKFYLKTKPYFSDTSKKRFEDVAFLSPEDDNYRSVVLEILLELEKEKFWRTDELNEIRIKIKQYL